MTRNRWSNYSKRSVKRWHRLPTIEVKTYVATAMGTGKPTSKTFTGLTWRHADRRANRWLSNR